MDPFTVVDPMSSSPSLWGRVASRLQGEVPASTLEAYERASLPVFDLLDQVEHRRLACAADGLNPWTVPPATRAEFLCAWNAFVLQTLGNAILQADFREAPLTAGYVPPITADQVLTFYTEVEGWLNRAQQAHANPEYRLDVPMPARLPAWSEVEPCPNSHLSGMLHAMRTVGEHAGAAMSFLPHAAPGGPTQQAQLNRMRQVYASAESKARYAESLHGVSPSRDVHERLEPYAKEAIELYWLLGQLVADPSLATSDVLRAGPPASAPGQPGFDPWCLTDPEARKHLSADRAAHEAVQQMWKLDPNPAATRSLHAEIQAAVARRDVEYAVNNGKRLGYFFCCPWGSVYQAKRPVAVGGTRVRAGQQFVFDVSAEGMNLGARFKRRIMVRGFHAVDRLEYGDPNEAPDH
jgi:hypothetical protein